MFSYKAVGEMCSKFMNKDNVKQRSHDTQCILDKIPAPLQ